MIEHFQRIFITQPISPTLDQFYCCYGSQSAAMVAMRLE
jgi:hypothetical protein